jgi:hypothetical protein
MSLHADLAPHFSKGAITEAVEVAGLHPRLPDYLRQAPVLALCIRGKAPFLTLGALDRYRDLCDRGAKLRDLMAVAEMPLVMRRFDGRAIARGDFRMLRRLAEIEAITLGNAIPAGAAEQAAYIARLHSWMERHWRENDQVSFRWAVEKLAAPRSDLIEVRDYAVQLDGPFDPERSWGHLADAQRRWHRERNAERDERMMRNALGFLPEDRLDDGGHPDTALCQGYNFVALRTQAALRDEGEVMRHCVGSYAADVCRKRCSIVSIRQGADRLATIQIAKQKLVQIKGRYNAKPKADVLAAAEAYVRDVYSAIAQVAA